MKGNNDKTVYKYESKRYLHFDDRRKYNKKTENYVTNCKEIESHSFYPFLKYISKTEKYFVSDENPDSRPIKTKKRVIMYTSHIDNFIYKYYGEELNKVYNKWAIEYKIDESSIAYRYKNGERGKSNIDHAADVINQIHKMKSCYVIIGDFKGYFDNLNHQRLKDNLCKVLRVQKDNLPKHWFKVFQSVTKYSYYNQKLIHKYCGSDKQLRRNGQYKYFSSPEDFREFKSIYPISTNKNNYGIPQGTAISAVLSNVYAIEFDMEVNKLVAKYEGLYRRYSDDFIVVLPKDHIKQNEQFEQIFEDVISLIQKNEMEIEISKTKKFSRENDTILDYDNLMPSKMDYLGFVYDGVNVEMRGKSPYKFYRHARRLIEKAKTIKRRRGLKKMPYRRQIYRLYTDLGIDRRPYGNFITYATRSQKTFDSISPNTNNIMMKQVKNRRMKINRMLGYEISHNRLPG